MNTINIKALSEQVAKLSASGGGSDLPVVTAADNGKVLGVVEGSWNKMDAPTGIVDYSTTEQNTGRKWIDGRDIYCKTITGLNVALSNSDWITINDATIEIGADVIGFRAYRSDYLIPITLFAVTNSDTGNLRVQKIPSTSETLGILYVEYVKAATTETKKVSKKKTTK